MSTTRTMNSSIGGAGNIHKRDQIHVTARQCASPTNYHLDIGGSDNARSSSSSSSSSSVSSDSSTTSSSSKVNKLRAAIAERWERRNQRVSLYEAWNRKLPAYPSAVSTIDHRAIWTTRVFESRKFLESQETLVARASMLEKVTFKMDRVLKLGLDDATKDGAEYEKISD